MVDDTGSGTEGGRVACTEAGATEIGEGSDKEDTLVHMSASCLVCGNLFDYRVQQKTHIVFA